QRNALAEEIQAEIAPGERAESILHAVIIAVFRTGCAVAAVYTLDYTRSNNSNRSQSQSQLS
ncbi:MAG TPA: hypothetical protein VEW70_05670, partial [Burkholderiales bacterium]|nr:hypothetical protein [Burkholderiales bacterium]